MTAELEGEVQNMCNLSECLVEQGIQQGILLSIKNLMASMKLSAEDAMNVLGIPLTEQEFYSQKLEK
jgi:hypothetical protein